MKANSRAIQLDADDLAGIDPSRLVDVRFDGHRVWSVRLPDAVEGRVSVPWPRPIKEKLHGRTDITIENSSDSALLASFSARFGRSRERVAVVDKRGQWMAMTKWDRLGPVLEGGDSQVVQRLLTSGTALVADLESWGYPVYLVGGSLLGVVRGGAMLPHDDDIDFAYLSDASDPADLALESYDMERKLVAAGWTVVRHSLAHLEVVCFDDIGEIDHYIDVFTGFIRDGLYCQPFALRGPEVTREDLVPTQTMSVNGFDLPAPAHPEAWLRYAYGENWRIPDPTFKFVVESGTKYRFNSWFGVFNRARYFWEKSYQGRTEQVMPPQGEADVEDFLARIPAGSHVIDLGCGDGILSAKIASAGHRVVGIDYAHEALRIAKHSAGPTLKFMRVNLNDRAATLELAAQMLRTRQPWYVFMRDTIHGMTHVNRENVFLLLEAALRPGTFAYLTFYDEKTVDYRRGNPDSWSYGVRRLRRNIRERKLAVVERGFGKKVGRRARAIVVLEQSDETRAEREAWEDERDEDIQ